jgi:hypothetical protein
VTTALGHTTPRPVVEVQERRRSSAAGPHRGQRRGRSAVQAAAIEASLIECGEGDWWL